MQKYKVFYEVGGYGQMIIISYEGLDEMTCTCMHSTMEQSRHRDWKDRTLCKHLKRVQEMIDGKLANKQ